MNSSTAFENAETTSHRNARVANWVRWFNFSAGAILLFTGVAKVVSASGSARALDSFDPIFAISLRHLLLSVGLLELAVSAICLLSGRIKLALYLVAWLAANFLFYHAGFWLMGWSQPCNCLGNVTDAIHLSSEVAGTVAEVISIYLFAGSVGSILASKKVPDPVRTAIGL